MRISTQNLNDNGLKWLSGRAWFRGKDCHEKACLHWCFGKTATNFSVGIHFHNGECDDGIMLHASIPWIFSFYLSIPGVMKRGKESELGVTIHNGGIWFHPCSYVMEHNSKDPWWRKTHSCYFPWTLDHHKTEILDGHSRECVNQHWLPKVVFIEISGRGKRRLRDSFKERQEAEKSVSKSFDYTYRLKNGTIQNRIATVYVDRMTWRARWWPIIPRQKVRTSIDVNFNEEVGEKTGSWKGGCIGCGYEMLPFETPEQTLRRMESERKF